MRLVPSYHSVIRWAQRVDRRESPTAADLERAGAALSREFEHPSTSVEARFDDGTRIVVSRRGIHCVVVRGEIVTVLEPGTPVNGCYCTWCLVARAPSTAKACRPPRIPPTGRLRKEN